VEARNRVTGSAMSITKGKVMCLVKIEVPARSRMASHVASPAERFVTTFQFPERRQERASGLRLESLNESGSRTTIEDSS